MRIHALVFCAALVWPVGVAGDTITLPTGPPDGGSCGIFGCGTRYQQIYGSSLVPSPFSITSITFFNTTAESAEAFIEPARYQFRLGATATSWDAMTTNFDGNATGPLVTVADFSVTEYDFSFTPGPGVSRTIALTLPFLYDPRMGSLILDVLKSTSEEAGDGPVYIDHNSRFAGVSSASNFAPGGVESSRFVHLGGGIVTQFNGTALSQGPGPVAPTPEPASLLLLATGAAILHARRSKFRG